MVYCLADLSLSQYPITATYPVHHPGWTPARPPSVRTFRLPSEEPPQQQEEQGPPSSAQAAPSA